MTQIPADRSTGPVPAVATSGDGLGGLAPLPSEPGQEVEIWWGGYAARTMLPAFTLCGLLTLSVLLIGRLVWEESAVPHTLVGHLVLYLVLVIWVVVLVRWAYLTVSITYRVTSHRLYHQRGFGHPAPEPIELARVSAVRVEQKIWERWVGVGRLRIETDDGKATTLIGIRTPEHVAAEALKFVGQIRAQGKGTPQAIVPSS
jgi:hypothetical protein